MGFFGKLANKKDKAPFVTYPDDSQEASGDKAADSVAVIPAPPETAIVSETEVVKIVADLPGKGDEKITRNPQMKDVAPLNTLADKAVASAGALYRTVEIVQKGAIPLDLVVSTMVTAVHDFNELKTELHTFQRDGVWSLDEVMAKFADISEECAIITEMVKSQQDMETILGQLDGLLALTKSFLELVSARCRELQSLRKRTAHAWLAATGVASVTVGGAAAAMCVLSGGAAMPVLAPLLAFGAGSTAIATASHIAFSSSLGAQIKDLDQQTKQLGSVQQDVKMIERKAESKKQAAEDNMIDGKPRKKFWW